MLKIDYLSSGIKESELHDEYLSCFDIASMQKNLDKLFSTTKFKGVKRYSVKEILIAPIETLLGYTDKLSKIKLTDGQTKTLKEIFNYDNPDFGRKMQPFIADFFMKKSGLS